MRIKATKSIWDERTMTSNMTAMKTVMGTGKGMHLRVQTSSAKKNSRRDASNFLKKVQGHASWCF